MLVLYVHPEVSCSRRGGWLSCVYCYLQMDLQNLSAVFIFVWVPKQSFVKSVVYIFILQMGKVRFPITFWATQMLLPRQEKRALDSVSAVSGGGSLLLSSFTELQYFTQIHSHTGNPSSSPKAEPLLFTGWRSSLGFTQLPDSLYSPRISHPLFPATMILPLP